MKKLICLLSTTLALAFAVTPAAAASVPSSAQQTQSFWGRSFANYPSQAIEQATNSAYRQALWTGYPNPQQQCTVQETGVAHYPASGYDAWARIACTQ